MIVLDTNVVSELMRSEPDRTVLAWVRDHVADDLRTTAVTVAEILYGVCRLPAGGRRDRLEVAATTVFDRFSGQVLAFDQASAQIYGSLVVERELLGRPIDGFDAQIAAICRRHHATLATRNVKDFDSTGVDVIDPWDSRP